MYILGWCLVGIGLLFAFFVVRSMTRIFVPKVGGLRTQHEVITELLFFPIPISQAFLSFGGAILFNTVYPLRWWGDILLWLFIFFLSFFAIPSVFRLINRKELKRQEEYYAKALEESKRLAREEWEIDQGLRPPKPLTPDEERWRAIQREHWRPLNDAPGDNKTSN
jgi:magnesium-transporting ATPase (P-type)